MEVNPDVVDVYTR